MGDFEGKVLRRQPVPIQWEEELPAKAAVAPIVAEEDGAGFVAH